jgi:5-methylcytosine-specific restriction enzyme A
VPSYSYRFIVILGFARNPDVVAEVMIRANGICESCRKEARFFRRKDGTSYLEVHHIKQLADDGEDTVANAIALCPNSSRKALSRFACQVYRRKN